MAGQLFSLNFPRGNVYSCIRVNLISKILKDAFCIHRPIRVMLLIFKLHIERVSFIATILNLESPWNSVIN